MGSGLMVPTTWKLGVGMGRGFARVQNESYPVTLLLVRRAHTCFLVPLPASWMSVGMALPGCSSIRGS